jgi:tRNA(fMet)-specific endonuclease VapC
MNRAILDTDMLSEPLKGRNASVRTRASSYRQQFHQLTISVVSVMEVVKGFRKVGREAEIVRFLSTIALEETLPVDLEIAERAGRIHADLELAGQPIGWADVVIAATAIRHGLELVTGNTAHYARIQALGYPLLLDNWRV